MVRPRWFSPTTATIAIVVAAAIGGGLVWRAGGEVRARDLAAYRAWERDALPVIDLAERLVITLPAGDLDAADEALTAARDALAAPESRPEVLRPTMSWFVAAFEAGDAAIHALRSGADASVELERARARFATARENLEMLRARLRLQPL